MKSKNILSLLVVLALTLSVLPAFGPTPVEAMFGDGEDINIIAPTGSSTVSGYYPVVVDSYAELDGYDWYDFQAIYWLHDDHPGMNVIDWTGDLDDDIRCETRTGTLDVRCTVMWNTLGLEDKDGYSILAYYHCPGSPCGRLEDWEESEEFEIKNIPDLEEPIVEVTNPGTTPFESHDGTISVSATASDLDGTIEKVDFYWYRIDHEPELIDTDTSSPYSVSWDTEEVFDGDDYRVRAIAYDDDDQFTTDDCEWYFEIDNYDETGLVTVNDPNGEEVINDLGAYTVEIEVQDEFSNWEVEVYFLRVSQPGVEGFIGSSYRSGCTDNEDETYTCEFDWYTLALPDGYDYLVKAYIYIHQSGYEYIMNKDSSDDVFTVDHIISQDGYEVYVENPNGGEVVEGTIDVHATLVGWTPGSTLTFYYRINSGMNPPPVEIEEIIVAEECGLSHGVAACSIDWDTTEVDDGANYVIRVEAEDSITSDSDTDESDADFEVDNE